MLAVVGLLVLLLVALQVVLRPQVLTRMVNRLAAEYVDGDVSFREVKAHVIKSFPRLELEAGDFSLTYPHQRYAAYDSLYPEQARRFSLLRAGQGREEPVDTLAALRQLRVSLDYMAFLRGGEVKLHRVELVRPRIFAHVFDSTRANWDILPLGGDTSAGKKSLPPIELQQIRLTDRPMVVYTRPADTLYGMFTLRRLALEGRVHTQEPDASQGCLEVDSLLVSGRLPSDTLLLRLDALRLQARDRAASLQARAALRLATRHYGRLRVPVELDIQAAFPQRDSGLAVDVQSLLLKLSTLAVEADGRATQGADGWDLDLSARMQDGDIGTLIREYQDNIPFFKKLRTNAHLNLTARAQGHYGGGQKPAVEASVQIPPADVTFESLGGRLSAQGSVQDLLGRDPLLALDGKLHVRVDSLTRALTQELVGTGRIDARLHGKARFSQLTLARMGNAAVEGHFTAQDLAVEMPADSLRAVIPQLEMTLSTRANQIDRNLRKGARVLALQSQFDSLDVRYKGLRARGANLRLLMQNSAEILKGGKDLTSLMGLLDVGSLDLRDQEGMSLVLRDNRETFRITPAGDQRPVPQLSLRSRSQRLRLRQQENLYAVRDLQFQLSAARHQSRAPQRRLPDSLRRVRPTRPQDEFASADVHISLSKALQDYLRNWDIDGNLSLGSCLAQLPAFPLRTELQMVEGSFDNDTLDLKRLRLRAGVSDLSARAQLTGLRRALLGRGRGHLRLNADVSSDYLDANELLRAYAYSTTYRPQAETQADTSGKQQLLILPANLDVQLSLESTGIRYDSLLVNWAAADIAMRQRTLQVTNAVAASNMGDIYFEGFYATRSRDDLQLGFDLNLVDITAEKVITLFPAVDSIIPMLRSFAGDLDCELAATSAVDTNMNLVLPSIDGIMKISGKDLSLNESQEFSKIAKLLMFKDRQQARIDNMAVAGLVRDNVLEVFPFVLDVDRYLFAASGIQQLDGKFNYHISVIRSPLLVKFGLNAWGPDFDDVHYWLSAPKYRSAQVPVYTRQLDTAQYSLVAAIHNIFELGVEKALQENRTRRLVRGEASLAVPADTASRTQMLDSLRQMESLLGEVQDRVSARRETLREEVLRLEQAAALKNDPPDMLSEAKNL